MNEKIPFYNLLNMFLIGLVFAGCNILMFMAKIIPFANTNLTGIKNIGFETVLTVFFFAVIYEIGLIINRIGSVIIEPILKKTKLIPFNNNYKKFNEVKKTNSIMDVLSMEYALARSTITLFFILSIVAMTQLKWILVLVFVGITVLFILSARKHCFKITELMRD